MYNQKSIHSPDDFFANDSFAEILISEADLVMPMLSEQLLRKFIIGEGDSSQILNVYLRAFNTDPGKEIKLVILKPLEVGDTEAFFFIKNTAQQYIGKDNLYLSTILNDFVVIVTSVTEQEKIGALLDKIRSAVTRCYRSGIMAIYSETVHFEYLPEVYERLKVCTGYSFYADSNQQLCV